MFNNFKGDSNKQMSQVRKSIQDLDQKVSGGDQNVSKTDEKCKNTGGKFNKEITILENNQTQVLKMKESINHKKQMENIINRQAEAEQSTGEWAQGWGVRHSDSSNRDNIIGQQFPRTLRQKEETEPKYHSMEKETEVKNKRPKNNSVNVY